MKRIALILSILIVSAGAIIAGNYHWKQSVDKTKKHAEVALHISSSDQTGKKDSPAEQSSSANDHQAGEKGSNSSSSTVKGQPNTNQTGHEGQTPTNQNGGTQTTGTGGTSNNASGDTSSIENTDSSPKKKTVEEIKNEYRSLFGELEAAETSKIDQLVVAAKAEYVSKNTSKSALAAKYQSAAKQMEQTADSSFNVLYQQLQYDLDKNGYSLNEAQEFSRAYNAKKQEHMNRIISQVRGF